MWISVYSFSEYNIGEGNYLCGYVRRSLHGHPHLFSYIIIKSGRNSVLSASWNINLWLWDIYHQKTTHKIMEHSNVILRTALLVNSHQLFWLEGYYLISFYQIKYLCIYIYILLSIMSYTSLCLWFGKIVIESYG